MSVMNDDSAGCYDAERRGWTSRMPCTAGNHNHRSAQAMHLLALTLLFMLAGMLSGCGGTAAGSADAHATKTAGAQATQTAQPVSVAVAVSQQGTLAASNVQLALTVTITNRTSQPIAISDVGCPTPTMVVEIQDAAGKTLWQNYPAHPTCPINQTRDVWTIAAGASLSQAYTADLYKSSLSSSWVGHDVLRAGLPYTVVAEIPLWHQGTLSDIDRPGVPQGRNVAGQATIVFR